MNKVYKKKKKKRKKKRKKEKKRKVWKQMSDFRWALTK